MSILKKVSLAAILSLILFVGFNQNTLFAASIGGSLPQPEEGWTRYDNTNPGITYDGIWNTSNGSSTNWNNGYAFTTDSNATAKFGFTGTKIRFIHTLASNNSQAVSITIDGVSEIVNTKTTDITNFALVYEKLNLAQGNHTVELKNLDTRSGRLRVDAIDIDGELFPISQPPVTEPEPEPEPEQPSSKRAILVVTMTTGLEKEYDLSMDEVNAFINWYDAKDAGSGPSKYAIDKHDNNKGPFSKRTDYLIFNNILTFGVSEYSTVTSATYQNKKS
ncbi:hypothetical protein RJP21_04495 [Paenibacillus sp. VCA1]|uniref:hypothetical protein n=1 Tax=Paenibacillus sp. VCA1 TaxID=3039148 RepID=UPI0028719A61|nr:hypothetical protein [Paenibacillus sp. VCA1]MDR9852863.1 hypothetical protein [Paenibacillus sp. VCA1]